MWGEHTSDLQINDISQDETVKKSPKSRGERELLKILKMERRKRNLSFKSRQSRREGEFFPKILKIESRKRIFPSKSHKSRGKREIFFSIFKIESRKRNCSFKSLKSRGERENFLKNPENRD